MLKQKIEYEQFNNKIYNEIWNRLERKKALVWKPWLVVRMTDGALFNQHDL